VPYGGKELSISSYDITLGASIFVHTGYHGALLSSPPPGIKYHIHGPKICYQSYYSREKDFSPFEHFCVGEYHYYDGRHSLIHSAHYPIINKDIPWLVDTDSIMVYLLYGSYSYFPDLLEWRKSNNTKKLIIERINRMLELYSSSECLAVLFRTQSVLDFNLKQCLTMLPSSLNDNVENIFKKSVVCYPARKPMLSQSNMRKRNATKVKRILFGCRSFEDKGGHLVLRLFEELLNRRDVDLYYIGPIPGEARARYKSLLSKMHYTESMPQDKFHDVLKQSHLFIYPTRYESPGNVFLEALACGLPIITSSGPGMESIEEIVFNGKGGILIKKNSVESDIDYAQLKKAVHSIIEDDNTRMQMSEHNLSLVMDGSFSISHRNKTLLPYYRQALRKPALYSVNNIRKSIPDSYIDSSIHLFVRSEEWYVEILNDFLENNYTPLQKRFLVPPVDLNDK